jgi:hypothetical protein
MLHTHHLSSGAGTIGQLMADVPSGLSLTLPQEKKSRRSVTSSVGEHKSHATIRHVDLYVHSSIRLHGVLFN